MDFAEYVVDAYVDVVEPYCDDYFDGCNVLQQSDASVAISNTINSVEAQLTVGQYETGIYGMGFQGTSDPDGVVSFAFQSPSDDFSVFVQGFDIDTSTEVEVRINDVIVGYLDIGADNSLQLSTLEISQSHLIAGENILSFHQTNIPGEHWGVTDILVLADGLNVSELPIDPEFSEDGYVAWQTDQFFYLGQMDPNSGALITVLNQVAIRPTDIRVTQQGPEIIETTTDGVGAIGVSPFGLVHYTATDATLLANTVGFQIGYMPKGETPGLRFTAHDGNGNIFLYDNGTITPLDLNGGIVTSWLNESEFLVSYRPAGIDQIGIYDLDTGVMTIIANEAYGSPAHQAAYTASDGTQYLALAGDGYHDLWRNDGSGWMLFRQVTCLIPDRPYFYSPEFFEWQGGVYLVGVASGYPGAPDSVPALYEISGDNWCQPGAQQGIAEPIVDPEIVVMQDSLAYYYSDISTPGGFVEYFFTFSVEDALDATILDPSIVIWDDPSSANVPATDNAGATFASGWLAWWSLEQFGPGIPQQWTKDWNHLTDLSFGFATTFEAILRAYAAEDRSIEQTGAFVEGKTLAGSLLTDWDDDFVFKTGSSS